MTISTYGSVVGAQEGRPVAVDSLDSAGTELLLFICTSNTCRSALGELVLRRGLAEVPGVRIASAGTRAHSGAVICHRVAERYGGDRQPGDAAAHRSSPLTAGLLAEATLVLAAAQDVRADILRLAPEVQDRTYTMREAAYFGRDFAPGEPGDRADLVSHYAGHLQWARAFRNPMPTPRLRLRRARDGDARDILDGHTHGRREHRHTLRDVATTSAAILGQLGRGAIVR